MLPVKIVTMNLYFLIFYRFIGPFLPIIPALFKKSYEETISVLAHSW